MVTKPIADIALSLGLSEEELYRQAMLSLLYEKKRQLLQQKLELLARYGTDTVEELETKIAEGVVNEHPAWEDLIVAENIIVRLEELNVYIENLQYSGNSRSE